MIQYYQQKNLTHHMHIFGHRVRFAVNIRVHVILGRLELDRPEGHVHLVPSLLHKAGVKRTTGRHPFALDAETFSVVFDEFQRLSSCNLNFYPEQKTLNYVKFKARLENTRGT